MEQLPTILGGLILAGVLWIAKTVSAHSVTLAELRTTLTGAKGDNGIAGEVKQLRAKAHEQAGEIQALTTRSELHELRLDNHDQLLSA